MAVEYKFKPYAPTKLKKKKVAGVDDVEKTIKSLEKQRENLNERLRAEGIDPETLGGEFDNRNLLEKALNLPADQGLLMDFFEVLQRPVEAVKGMLTAGNRGDDAITGFAEGLAGKQEMSGSEFTKQFLGIEAETKVGKFLLDIGTDIALDPLTYLPPGIIAKGLSKLGKIGSKTITVTGADVATKLATKVDDIIKLANAGNADALAKVMTAEQIEALADVSKAGLKGGTAEDLALGEIKKLLKGTGLDDLLDKFAVVDKGTIRGTAEQGLRNTKDLSVMFEYKPGQFIEVSKIEVKDLLTTSKTGVVTRGGAFGVSSAISLDDIAGKGTSKLKNRFLELTEGVTVTVNGTEYSMGDYVKNLIDTKQAGGRSIVPKRGGLKISDKAKVEDALRTVFLEDLADAGVDFVTFRYGENKLVTISRETLEKTPKLLGIKSAQIGVKASGAKLSKATVKGIGGQIAKEIPAFGSSIKKIFNKFTTIKQTSYKAGQVFDGFRVANSNIVIDLAGIDEKTTAQIIERLQKGFQVGGQRVNISSVAKLDDGRYVFKTSAADAAKQSRDLIATIDLVDEAGKPLADDAIEALDESLGFQQSLITPGEKGTGTITQTLTLAGRARAGEFGKTIQTVAKAYKSFEIKFKLTFNLTAGFDAKTKALLMRAQGADMFDLERRSGVLADIKQKLIQADPDAGELLGELIEADAKLVDGKIIKLRREVGTSDFADYMYNAILKGDGDRIAIPAFADKAAETNFLDRLNRLYKDATGSTDIMFTVKKGATGGTVLAFAGDASEMKDLIKYIADPANIRNIDDYLEFGEKALSKKAKAFLRNNADQVARYKQLTDELLDDLINIAGFKNMPVELQNQIGYMRHTMTKGAMEGMRQQFPGVLSIYTKKGTQTLGKRNIMGSVQEINAVLRDFYGIADDFFDPNAFNAMEDFIKQVSRKMDQKQVLDIILANKGVDGSDLFKVVDNTQAAKAAMSPYDVMIKDFREDFSTLYENLAPEAQKAFDDFLLKNGFGDGKAIQLNKSAFNVLKGVEKAYFDVPELVKIYDKFLTNWKGLTLITPGFHMRNLFGNMFNSYAVGMDVIAQGKYLGTAMQELDTFQKVGKKLAQGLDITDAERAIYDTVKGYFERGVSQTHRGIRDLESVMEASAKGAAKPGTLKNTYNNVIRFNFNVAEKMDDVQRYALYRWSLDKTGDGVKAANTVAEALFDYSHLTPFEKSYMKRLFPFYTFMKNNFVFQMKNIFINPKQYARLGRAYKYASEDLAGYSLDDLPDYATENMWIPLPWTVDKNDKDAVAFLKATLPASDFTELVENPFKKGVTSITAPIKLLIEFGAGKDLFTGQPLEAFPGQTSAMPEGTGILSSIRDRRGNLTISQSPIFIKIMNDLGLRAPINIASAGLDVVDTLAGYQGGVENLGDFLQRAGIAGVSEMDRLKLSKLYQDLEKLRELKKFYEQETGNQLPVLPRG